MKRLTLLKKILDEVEENIIRSELDIPFDRERSEALTVSDPATAAEYKARYTIKTKKLHETQLYLQYLKGEIEREELTNN